MAAFAVFIPSFHFPVFAFQWSGEMRVTSAKIRNLLLTGFVTVGCLATIGICGCTVWGAKKSPTLQSSTSAEQYERITWDNVRAQRWDRITSLLAPNVVYAVGGRVLARDQIVPYLESERIRDVAISDMAVKPNGADMTLSYSLQLSSTDGKMQSLIGVSVWQQLGTGWVLIAHAEQPRQN